MAMVTSSSTFISRASSPRRAPTAMGIPPARAPAIPSPATTAGGPPARKSSHEARVSRAVRTANRKSALVRAPR